jgi:regulatory protein
MKITMQPKDGEYGILTIHLDDEPWRDIQTAIFGRKPDLPDACLSQDEWEEKFLDIEKACAKKYVLKRLVSKDQPTTELRKVLKERLVSPDVIDWVIAYFERHGYINDEEWTTEYITRQQSRKIGPRVIALKLMAKGIPQEKAQQAVDSFFQQNEQKTVILQLLLSKYKAKNLQDFHVRHKITSSLIRKGYDLGEIREAISEALLQT